MKRSILSIAAALLAAITLTGTAAAASRPDVACMQAGIRTLQGARLLDDVARGGIAIDTAVSLGVTVRAGADISGFPNPIPFSLLLADHRAGDSSVFVYPGLRVDTSGPVAAVLQPDPGDRDPHDHAPPAC
jgi:hypothetical protein